MQHLLAPPYSRHDYCMGRDRGPQAPDLFSTGSCGETFSPAANPVTSAPEPRHVLPKDLPNAVKHLHDRELDLLIAAALAEAKRRGRQPSLTDKPRLSRQPGVVAASLTRGQVNAVRAAFKAGITPARIARQFGLSRSDVRKALTTDASGRGTVD
jgi:hypothetical protein